MCLSVCFIEEREFLFVVAVLNVFFEASKKFWEFVESEIPAFYPFFFWAKRWTTFLSWTWACLRAQKFTISLSCLGDLKRGIYTFQGTSISHLGKRKIVFKSAGWEKDILSQKLTVRTWKWMVEILLSFWDGLIFRGYISFRECSPFWHQHLFTHKKDGKNGPFKNWAFKKTQLFASTFPEIPSTRAILPLGNRLPGNLKRIHSSENLAAQKFNRVTMSYYDFHMGNGWATL